MLRQAVRLNSLTEVALTKRSSSFSWNGGRLELPMKGRFNIANAVAAATRPARRSGTASNPIVISCSSWGSPPAPATIESSTA